MSVQIGACVENRERAVALPNTRDEATASLHYLSDWLDKYQHVEESKNTRVIVLDSFKEGQYGFQAAFLIFVLDGDINLSTKKISNANFYVVAPVWGRVNMMEDISGDLNGTITCKFQRGPNVAGQFTLSLDKTTDKLVIEYDFAVKFAGELRDKIPLFKLPKVGTTQMSPPGNVLVLSSMDNVPRQAQPTSLSCYTHTEDHKLFDKWLEDHLDEQTQNIVIHSFIPSDIPRMASSSLSATKSHSFSVSFLGIFELEGAIDPVDIGISATLYVRVPLWGRTKITSLSGSLRKGINLDINVLVASGSIGLRLVGSDVHIAVKLHVKFVGDINQDIKLFTLPFKMYR